MFIRDLRIYETMASLRILMGDPKLQAQFVTFIRFIKLSTSIIFPNNTSGIRMPITGSFSRSHVCMFTRLHEALLLFLDIDGSAVGSLSR